MSQSEPMDPKLPPLNKLEGFAEKVEYGMDGAGVDCVDAETTDECSDEDVMSIQTLEMTPRQTDADGLSLQTPEMTPRHIDADVLSIQTPEMTPRHMDVESPVHSSTVSLTGTPGSWTAAQFPVQEHQVVPAWNSQGASETMLIPAEPAWYLQLPADPALLYPPYSLTLRLAEKGGLGIKFGNLPGCDTLFVRRIVPGYALDSWNRQCMFGNVANMSRYVSLEDVLISVNEKSAPHEMLQECQEKLLLKMTFGRTGRWNSCCRV